MPKPMRVTPQILGQIAEQLMKKLPGMQILDGKLAFSQDFSFRNDERVKVEFTEEACEKMFALIDYFSTEVAWHGLVSRVAPNHFLVEKILVYPQTVTGVTVETDQEAYDTWLMTINDEDFAKLKFQAHSHVNMACSPSGTDLEHQGKIVAQLNDEGFYIFMILNKRREYIVKVYDADNNTLYEKEDVDIIFPQSKIRTFIEEANSLIATRRYTPAAPTTGGGKSGAAAKTQTASTKQPQTPKKARTKADTTRTRPSYANPVNNQGFDIDDVDDYDDFIFGGGYHQY